MMMDKRTALRPKRIHNENAIKSSGIKRPSSVMANGGQAKARDRANNPQKRVVLGTVTNTSFKSAAAAKSSKLPVYHDNRTNDKLTNNNNNHSANNTTNQQHNNVSGSDDTEIEEDNDEDDEEEEDDDYGDVRAPEQDDDEGEGSMMQTESTTNPNPLAPDTSEEAQLEFRHICEKVTPILEETLQDDEDLYDVSMVTEYSDEIFQYMRRLEKQMSPDPFYMDQQNEIHWSMRSILIDWLVQVHHRFNLLPETLFLTINYIDRFLSLKVVSLSKFQLVGAVALFLAAKYEEINCPSVQEIAYMVDHGYSVEEILKAERYMIDMLEFNLGWPGPMSFLRRTSKADDYDLETRTLAKYLLELTIMDKRFVASPPSWTAAAAHCLARRMLQRGPWTNCHVYFSGYTLSQLQPAIDAILESCKDPQANHNAIYEKYTDRRFKRASLFVKNWMDSDQYKHHQKHF
jgi:G2/mitotic-specific cyclin 3/4